jgi:hypothetical protein
LLAVLFFLPIAAVSNCWANMERQCEKRDCRTKKRVGYTKAHSSLQSRYFVASHAILTLIPEIIQETELIFVPQSP